MMAGKRSWTPHQNPESVARATPFSFFIPTILKRFKGKDLPVSQLS
jgi:hypothetical protein